ncbi:TolB family protein, partial [Henriciella pelagia]
MSFTTNEGTHLSLDVSPDGQSIVFDMLGDIYVLPITGGEAKALTRGLALDTQPVFSPDGQTILFISDRSGAENLWKMDADGGNARQISYYDDNPVWVSPEWSPDGSRIIASRYWSDRNSYELWQFDPAPGSMGEAWNKQKSGTESTRSFSSLGPTFHPGGCDHFIASRSADDVAFDQLATWTIVSIDAETGEEQTLAGSEINPAMRPRLSPDGTHLAFAERQDNRTFLKLKVLGSGETRTLGELDPDSLQASAWHDAVPRFDFLPDGSAVI